MGEVNKKFIGLSQFKAPFNFELAGKHFHLCFDCGQDFSVQFVDGEVVQYAEKGQPYVWDTYQCLKGDDTTYLVLVEPAGHDGKLHYNLILDLEQRLCTVVTLEEGYDPEYPRLIRVTPYFGAIKLPGRELPKIRHHLDDRMVGKHIVWHYNPGFSIEHIYHTPICIRADLERPEVMGDVKARLEAERHSDDPEIRANAEKQIAEFERRRQYYPFYEEECFHIWIKENLNLMCFLEENMNRLDPERYGGGGGILLLQDIERVTDVGTCFSGGEYYMCTAFGDENSELKELDTKPSPYDWSKFDAMPSIYWDIPKSEE